MHRPPVSDRLFWVRLARLGLGAEIGGTERLGRSIGIYALLFSLVRAIRAERARCRQAHWTGDLNRLAGLRSSFRALWPLRHAYRRQ